MVKRIADWYSDGGNIVLAFIAYVLQFINTILMDLGLLISMIVLMDDNLISIGLGIFIIIFGIAILTIINLVVLGFLKGHVQWLENIKTTRSQASLAYSATKNIETKTSNSKAETNKVAFRSEFFNVQQKPKEKVIAPVDPTMLSKGIDVKFRLFYVGKDENGITRRVTPGTEGKVVTNNKNISFNIEIVDSGEKVVLVDVGPHNLG